MQLQKYTTNTKQMHKPKQLDSSITSLCFKALHT